MGVQRTGARLLEREAITRDLLLQATDLLQDVGIPSAGHSNLGRAELKALIESASEALALAHAATEKHQDVHLCGR